MVNAEKDVYGKQRLKKDVARKLRYKKRNQSTRKILIHH